MTSNIDEFDKRLIYELDKNSKMPLSKLSRKIGRSKQFTLFHMKKLQERGIITNYSAIVDMATLGFFTFRVYVKFKQTTRKETDKIADYVNYSGLKPRAY